MNISYDAMQANRKDLQRFLGLNDDNEMVSLFFFLLGIKDLDKQTPMRPKNISDPGQKNIFDPGLHSQCAQTAEAGFSQQGAGDAIRYGFVRPGVRDI